ncbi:pleckstrin homology domain-containing family M member 2 isoform X2 [Prionailurus bengalensis]|uniref:pleckstrin homology domain-containing family M member 2 isoform X2 n=1 Tax=Prionailurus bengalensis TaxID=37029 RepID=UPI001CAA0A0B|nr:pleckstrin homology domain-containing family M member 2 isoform X2 [Prionailurus bengalensis]
MSLAGGGGLSGSPRSVGGSAGPGRRGWRGSGSLGRAGRPGSVGRQGQGGGPKVCGDPGVPGVKGLPRTLARGAVSRQGPGRGGPGSAGVPGDPGRRGCGPGDADAGSGGSPGAGAPARPPALAPPRLTSVPAAAAAVAAAAAAHSPRPLPRRPRSGAAWPRRSEGPGEARAGRRAPGPAAGTTEPPHGRRQRLAAAPGPRRGKRRRRGGGGGGGGGAMEPREVKDRILENISLSVKKLQSYFAACEDETPAIRNHDKVLQRLCEHLDHALLYGLQDLSSGYWVLVVHFTRREAIKQIEVLQHVATNLGRSRAWLYLALNENSLESYLRLFQENLGLLHKYYVKNALVCSHDHLTLFLTLVSGLEFIRFDLDLDAPYLDLAPYMPDYYKPQYLLDFEDRLPSSVQGSDSLSLNSFNSVTSTNLEWDDSAIAPSSEDGDLTDTVSGPRSTASDPTSSKASAKSPTQRHNPFSEDQAETVSSSDTTPVHTTSQEKGEPRTLDLPDACTELEVIRVTKKKKTGKKKKTRSDEEASPLHPSSSQDSCARRGDGDSLVSSPGLGRASPDATFTSPQGEGEGPSGTAESSELPEPGQMGLLIPEMKDTSMERLGQPLSKVIDQLNGQLDPSAWRSHVRSPDQSFRTGSPGDAPEKPPFCDFSEGLPAPMDFYRFTVESPSALTSSGSNHDPAGPGQPLHVPGGPAAAGQEEGGGRREGQAPGPLEDTPGEAREPETRGLETQLPPAGDGPVPEAEPGTHEALCQLKRDQPSPCLSSAEDSGVDEGQGSPSEMTHSAEFRVDNNHLLLLMIHVFRENEEQLFKMIRMSTGHMEGTLQLLYVLLTDCYVYLLRKGAAEKPYLVEEAVSYNELDYVSVGLDQQTVKLVCTNRRKQFLLDTADVALAEFFLASLKSAMIKGCREPPYPSILTDATMEKLALAKFVAQESKCEATAVTVRFYGLVHWEDPLDESLGPVPCHCSPPEGAITKEGMLHYKAGTSYLGKEHWKTCFVVLSNGILYQYPDRTDVTPLLSVNMGGEQCGGCRRANTTDRPHAFQVILADRPCLELSADSEAEMAGWMQQLCQAVSKGVIPQGVTPSPCIPCCLVITDDRLFTCHEDCQTSFFRSLGTARLADISAVSTEPGKEYCVLEFSQDSQQALPPWVIYLSCTSELDRFLSALSSGWKTIYQVDLPHKATQEASSKKFEDALSLIHSAWQRSDSLCRGRASRDPWC